MADDGYPGMAGRTRGLTLLGAGREMEVFAWREGLVLRLARDPGRASGIARMMLEQTAIRNAGAPVPAVYEQLTVDGRPGVVEERVHGESLLEQLDRCPDLARSIGHQCGRLHAQLHLLRAPSQLPSLRQKLDFRLRSDAVPVGIRDTVSKLMEQLPDGGALCHGDFHPGNVMAADGRLMVIDWTLAARGDAAADVAYTLLVLLVGTIPEDMPVQSEQFEPFLRTTLHDSYLEAYREVRGLDDCDVQRWGLVSVAARLALGIPEEREPLLALARTLAPLDA